MLTLFIRLQPFSCSSCRLDPFLHFPLLCFQSFGGEAQAATPVLWHSASVQQGRAIAGRNPWTNRGREELVVTDTSLTPGSPQRTAAWMSTPSVPSVPCCMEVGGGRLMEVDGERGGGAADPTVSTMSPSCVYRPFLLRRPLSTSRRSSAVRPRWNASWETPAPAGEEE